RRSGRTDFGRRASGQQRRARRDMSSGRGCDPTREAPDAIPRPAPGGTRCEALGGISRRRLLAAGGGLVVAFAVRPAGAQGAGGRGGAGPELPGSLKTEPFLDGWIRIDAQGLVTVLTGKAELGQGIKTALVQVAAEELAVDPTRV